MRGGARTVGGGGGCVSHGSLSPLARPAEELLSSAYLVVAATCEEEPPTPARLASYYGKVVVCLHEAFSGHGVQLQSSVETILRSAKLKAPA